MNKVSKQKKKLFLHIGHGKTGTTSIQYFLANLLPDSIVHYPKTCRGDASDQYSSLQHLELHRSGWNSRLCKYQEGEDEKMLDDLRTEIYETSKEYIILSSECGLPHFDCFMKRQPFQDKLFKEFNDAFECKIVYYVRNQFQALESFFLQQHPLGVKKNSFDDFIRRQSDFGQFDYNSHIENYWSQVFGRENILAKVYNKNILKNGDVVQDFLELIGLYDKLWDRKKNINKNPTPEYATEKRGYLINSLNDSLKASIKERFYKSNIEFVKNYLDDVGGKMLLEGFKDD